MVEDEHDDDDDASLWSVCERMDATSYQVPDLERDIFPKIPSRLLKD